MSLLPEVTVINGGAGLLICICWTLQTGALERNTNHVYKLQSGFSAHQHSSHGNCVYLALEPPSFYLSPGVASANFRHAAWGVWLSSPAAVVECHKPVGLKVCFSQFRRRKVQDQGGGMVRFLVRAHFLVYRQRPSCCVLTWWRDRYGAFSSFIRTPVLSWGLHPVTSAKFNYPQRPHLQIPLH